MLIYAVAGTGPGIWAGEAALNISATDLTRLAVAPVHEPSIYAMTLDDLSLVG